MYHCPYCEAEASYAFLEQGGECTSCGEYVLGGIFLPSVQVEASASDEEIESESDSLSSKKIRASSEELKNDFDLDEESLVELQNPSLLSEEQSNNQSQDTAEGEAALSAIGNDHELVSQEVGGSIDMDTIELEKSVIDALSTADKQGDKIALVAPSVAQEVAQSLDHDLEAFQDLDLIEDSSMIDISADDLRALYGQSKDFDLPSNDTSEVGLFQSLEALDKKAMSVQESKEESKEESKDPRGKGGPSLLEREGVRGGRGR